MRDKGIGEKARLRMAHLQNLAQGGPLTSKTDETACLIHASCPVSPHFMVIEQMPKENHTKHF
jgi:hypothetical protein